MEVQEAILAALPQNGEAMQWEDFVIAIDKRYHGNLLANVTAMKRQGVLTRNLVRNELGQFVLTLAKVV